MISRAIASACRAYALGRAATPTHFGLNRLPAVAPQGVPVRSWRAAPLASALPHCREHSSAPDETKTPLLIMFGSQTGTAQSFAKTLGKKSKVRAFKPKVVDLEDFDPDTLTEHCSKGHPLILVMATYGNGEPTDNAVDFHQWLTSSERGPEDLRDAKYTVFGLGNSATYPERFNIEAKTIDKRMEALGGHRVYPLGLGDDSGTIEEDFETWKAGLWHALKDTGSVDGDQSEIRTDADIDDDSEPHLIFETHTVDDLPEPIEFRPRERMYTPVVCVENRELFTGVPDRHCRHVSFDISATDLHYEAGDHLAVAPSNCPVTVSRLGRRLGVDLDQYVSFLLDEENSVVSEPPFPSPCTIRHALAHFCDITGPPRLVTLKGLRRYCSDPGDRERLDSLVAVSCTPTESQYKEQVKERMMSIVDVLEELPSIEPPICRFLELLPPLSYRYYSISSSPKHNPNNVDLTVATVRQPRENMADFKGVSSNFLTRAVPGDSYSVVPVFVRPSTFKLPQSLDTPVTMIAAGSGFAPMRSFLQDRTADLQAASLKRSPSGFVLYFGCTHEEKTFIYRDEIDAAVKNGVISELVTAFSHDTDELVFVQHRLWEHRDQVWRDIEQGGHIYVCGSASTMAQAVSETIARIAHTCGGMSPSEAAKFVMDMKTNNIYQEDIY